MSYDDVFKRWFPTEAAFDGFVNDILRQAGKLDALESLSTPPAPAESSRCPTCKRDIPKGAHLLNMRCAQCYFEEAIAHSVLSESPSSPVESKPDDGMEERAEEFIKRTRGFGYYGDLTPMMVCDFARSELARARSTPSPKLTEEDSIHQRYGAFKKKYWDTYRHSDPRGADGISIDFAISEIERLNAPQHKAIIDEAEVRRRAREVSTRMFECRTNGVSKEIADALAAFALSIAKGNDNA